MCSKVAVMKSSKFEVARESLETVPSRSPGVGASPLGRDGPAPPLSRAAGALGQICRGTCSEKFWRRSGTGGTPGRIWTDHIVQIHGGEPPRAHRRAGRRGTRPRRQRGESSSRPAVTWQLDGGIWMWMIHNPTQHQTTPLKARFSSWALSPVIDRLCPRRSRSNARRNGRYSGVRPARTGM